MSHTPYPGLNFELGETADMLREAVYDFAQTEIDPLAAQIDSTNEFPPGDVEKAGGYGNCWVSPLKRNTAAPVWVTWSTWWPWRKSAGPLLP